MNDRLLDRLADVERRLAAHAHATVTPGALTDADQATGERWEAGQVWAHLAEFPAYWLDQIARVLEARRSGTMDAVPFGRTKTDPGRIAAIERARTTDRRRLMEHVAAGISATRVRLAALSDDEWSAGGSHPTLGEMPVSEAVERFIIGHLEEHAEQLDGLARARRSAR
ncbi:MAG: DinB family protein [Candidatus Limnocylindria bacterium]